MIGLNLVFKEAWSVSENSKDNREKLHALSLVKDCYELLEELLSNEPLISQAIKFESETKKEECVPAANPASGFDTNLISEAEDNEGDSTDDIRGSEERARESKGDSSTNNKTV